MKKEISLKESTYKILGVVVLFITLAFTMKLYDLIVLDLLLVLFFTPLFLYRYDIRDLTSKMALSFYIDNILIITWILSSFQMIKMLVEIELSSYKLLNIFLFIFLSYLFQFVMKKLYIADNSLSNEIKVDGFNFTKREKELIQYLVKGLKYREIAEELFISENTVKKHISNIYMKAGVKNKVELIYKTMNS